MPYSVQTFTWLTDDLEGGQRELTPRLRSAQVTWVPDDDDPHFEIEFECRDDVVADAWKIGDEVTIDFTLTEYGGVVEGTAEITNCKMSLDGPANYRACTLRLRPDAANVDPDRFPAVLREAVREA